MQVSARGPEEEHGPGLEFYTGRFHVIFDVGEVEELIVALKGWVDERKNDRTMSAGRMPGGVYVRRKS